MKTVLLDCDGVLADFTSALIPLINDELGTDFTVFDVTEFDFGNALGLSPEQRARVKRRIGSAVGFARGLKPYADAINAVGALRKISDVYIVTSPFNSNATWTYDREWWLREHFDIPHARVIHTSAKHLVRGRVFVDDKLDAVKAWSQEHHGVAVHWRTPHNVKEHWFGYQTNDWNKIISLVKA